VTIGPVDVFVTQLARASKKANRLIRDLPKSAREDILSAALLWCWENRESYSLTTSIETWFVNAVRNVYQSWRRGEIRNASELVNDISTGDTTVAVVEAREAATKLVAALTPDYRRVAELDARGYTRAQMKAKGLAHYTIDSARARIKQLRWLLPDDHEYRRVVRTAPVVDSDDLATAPPAIDREMEELETMPQHGADCPPCWLCMYFYGRLPGTHKRVRMTIHEPEVAKAVADTEVRKVQIAARVRAGTEE
jgi:hypothetical protein